MDTISDSDSNPKNNVVLYFMWLEGQCYCLIAHILDFSEGCSTVSLLRTFRHVAVFAYNFKLLAYIHHTADNYCRMMISGLPT